MPGILLASAFPAIIGSRFPGAVYASQTLKFKRPCFVGEGIEAVVRLRRRAGKMAVFETVCVSRHEGREGEVLVEGEAMAAMPPGEA